MNILLKISCLMSMLLLGYSVFAQQDEYGLAVRYSDQFQDTDTSNGELYDANKLTAAHKTLPFGTKVKVTNLDNRKSVVVHINDRGPFIKGHVIDLSGKAATQIGLERDTTAKVKVVAVKSNTKLAVTAEKPKKKASSKSSVAPKPTPKKKVAPSRSLGASKESVRILKRGDTGYGVQVGYYASESNAMKYVETLKAKWFKSISLNIDDSTGARRYKVILGDYPTRAAADSYLSNLEKKDIKGFVVNIAKLQK